MSVKDGVLSGLLLFCLVWIFFSNSSRSNALAEAERLEATIPALEAQRDSAASVAAALEADAVLSDSVVQAVIDSADAMVARVRPRLVVQRDTLEVLIQDTTALRMLDERDAMFESVISEKDSVIVAITASRDLWRSSSFAKDEVIARQDSLIATRAEVNAELRSHIRGQKRRQWGERGVAVAIAACAMWFCR